MKKEKVIFMKKRTIGLVMITSPYVGGVFQYENLIAEAIWNNRDKYNMIMVCDNSYWINWCIERNVKFIEGKMGMYKGSIEFAKNHPYIAALYSSFFSPQIKKIKEEKIELLVYGQQGMFLASKLIKQLCPIHDLMHRYETRFMERQQSKEDNIFRCELQFVTTVMVDSQLGKSQVIESYLQKRKKRPFIQVLPYVVSEHITDSKEEPVQTPDKYIFYPAQFWQHKNHLNLLKAVGILKKDIPDIHLILVGSEKNALNTIKEYIKENEMESFVTIYNFVSEEKLIYLYRHAAAMVMPSYFGPTNIPPLEAMALGCPAAVSNNYAMGEQVGDAGLLFDPDSPKEIADCISKLWNDSRLRETMREKGYQQIAKWRPKDFEKRLIETIDITLGI
ncbi:MAG: glycosyltransferase family 4 protein [Dorea sp.]|jgi:glycosyltransferase involved in cell wall biosynthesis|nr:glycosyltransferase family 4 protein [Dorea sp.]